MNNKRTTKASGLHNLAMACATVAVAGSVMTSKASAMAPAAAGAAGLGSSHTWFDTCPATFGVPNLNFCLVPTPQEELAEKYAFLVGPSTTSGDPEELKAASTTGEHNARVTYTGTEDPLTTPIRTVDQFIDWYIAIDPDKDKSPARVAFLRKVMMEQFEQANRINLETGRWESYEVRQYKKK